MATAMITWLRTLGTVATVLAVLSLFVLLLVSAVIRLLQRHANRDELAFQHAPPPSHLNKSRSSSASASATAFVIPVRVYHARFLPKESAHAFRYPSLYLALELGQLERRIKHGSETGSPRRRALDIARVLKYKVPEETPHPWTLSSINPPEYFRSSYDALPQPLRSRVESSIRLKALYELRLRDLIQRGPQDVNEDSDEAFDNLNSEIDQIWSITMPSLLGFQGINPLTTYFCYRPHADGETRGDLAFVLLEVHNTFTERHLYVLECGVNEDPDVTDATPRKSGIQQPRRPGCDHQWTFPRTFHVSPFNDRGGYYTCSVKSIIPAGAVRPILDIRVTLLIADPSAPAVSDASAEPQALVKKMVAVLTSHPATINESISDSGVLNTLRPLPLTATTFSLALLRQPLDLFFTFPRIAYEAARLHWGKNRLDVFGKPEMDDEAGILPSDEYDGTSWPPSLNPTEPNRGQDADGIVYSKRKSGALARSVASATDHFGRKALQAVLARNDQPGLIQVQLIDERKTSLTEYFTCRAKVVLFARSEAVYSDLLLYPPTVAHAVGSRVARRWGVSDYDAYISALHHLTESVRFTPALQLSHRMRAHHIRWALSIAPPLPPDTQQPESHARIRAEVERDLIAAALSAHPFENARAGPEISAWALFGHLLMLHLIARGEELAFRLIGARYVRGLEPWTEVRRAVELLVAEKVRARAIEQTQTETEAGGREAVEKASARDVAHPSWFRMGSSRRELVSASA
ncbi:hypothetical protein V8E36_000275 [Tilletia maclaganii]